MTRSLTTTLTRFAGAAAVVGTLALAAPAAHAEDSNTAAGKQARLEKACAKATQIETRMNTAISTIQGDPSTKGSLAFLQAKLAEAQANNRPKMVTLLEQRIDVRTKQLATLQARLNGVQPVIATCASKGL